MSRNLTVQLMTAGLMLALLIAVIINIVQFNSIESNTLEIRQKVEKNQKDLESIQDKLKKGVAVNGGGSGGGATTNNGGDTGAQGVTLTIEDPDAKGQLLTIDPTPLNAPDAVPGGTLNIPAGSDFKGWNFLVENSTDVNAVQDVLVHGLLARRSYADPNKWHGDLARSIIVSDDFKTYHVKLRKGVMWHKPAVDFSNPRYKWLDKDHEMTSDDFKFFFEMLLDDKVQGAASKRGYYKDDFDRIEVIGKHEFKLHWKKKTYQSKAYSLEIFPVPRWLYGHDEDGNAYAPEIVGVKFNSHWYNDRAVGVGPFRFVEAKPGEYVKLERNSDYFGGRPSIDKINIFVVKDNDRRLLMFKKGEVDFFSMTPTQYRKEILEGEDDSPFKNGTYKITKFLRLAYRYIGWNQKSELFKDKRVRTAMTHAFDRQRILSEVWVGLGKITTSNFFYESPSYDKSVQPYPFDLEKAKALLDEAGWKDTDGDGVRDKVIGGKKTKFEFRLFIYNNSSEYKALADIYKEDLVKIGVVLNVTPLDWPIMQKKMEDKDFEAFTGGWGLDWESDPHQLWHSTQADTPKASNFISFKNKEADEIIETARNTFDQEKRVELFHRFHGIMHEEQPYTFFSVPITVFVTNQRYQNFTIQKPRPHALHRLGWINEKK